MPVAIITGASEGLGRALAQELAAKGYRVGLIARREEPLRQACDELQAEGREASFAVADVTDREELEAAVAELRTRLGPVDLVIANAGIGRPDRLDPFDAQVAERTFGVNVLGALNTVGAVLPEMLQRQRGHIVGISSLGAGRGFPGSSAYSASKAALNNYLEGLRLALRPRGIAVTTVCPGFIRTNMTAKNDFRMPFLLEPDEAARRIVRRLAKRPAVYRFPLAMSLLMRGLRWLPEPIFARLLPPATSAEQRDCVESPDEA